MQTDAALDSQLKEAAQLTDAAWVALVERVNGMWLMLASYRLTKSAQNELIGIAAVPSTDAWMCGALSGRHVRSAALPENRFLGAGRFFAYPLRDESKLILVGANADMPAAAQRVWRLTASLLSGRSDPETRTLLPNLQSDMASNPPLALKKILLNFTQAVSCRGAWLAIRRGNALDIQAEWNAPKAQNASLIIEDNPILRRVNRSLADVALTSEQPNFDRLPFTNLKSDGGAWICLPLILGKRLIGVVALWRKKEFTNAERGQLRELAASVPHMVDMTVAFLEVSAHLSRLRFLNDVALTVSSAQNLDQIAQRIFNLLARSFDTKFIALFLKFDDGRILREYRLQDGKLAVVNTSVMARRLADTLEGTRARRVANSSDEKFIGVYESACSELSLPLRYHSQTIGALILESSQPEAFSEYDEYLMGVVASHLAGLIEYVRLREEAEGRARSLELIHEVVQQIIGLNDKKEMASIAANLVARDFHYEWIAILLADERGEFSIRGVGATQAQTFSHSLDDTMTRFLRGGENLLINDVSKNKAQTDLEAQSEICVAVKDGERILGMINARSREANAFSHNDFIAMESLAGILASVTTSADQYQRLQETIRQLRLTETELNERIEAQRAAENRLLQAAKLAAVGEMAAGVAHELNNPLTAVAGFSELALEGLPEDSPRRKDLLIVLQEAQRAGAVVRRLLDFSRQGERIRASADLNEVVRDVIALTRHLIKTSDVILTLELDESLPWILIDSNQMKQVLLNLIHNALQAMPRGGTLRVQTFSAERENKNWAVMSVSDSGAGIPSDEQSKIFEPFFTTKGARGGTGLGLSVTYSIVADHGGMIELNSVPAVGSTFETWLPL